MSEPRQRSEFRNKPTDRLERSAGPPAGTVRETVQAVRKTRGIWRDVVIRRDPDTGAEVVVEDTGWSSNKIVVGATLLIAGLLKNDPTFNGGILFSAQGTGDPSFDTNLPTPQFDETTLRNEYFRKAPDSITYLKSDGSAADPGEVTSRLLIETTLDFDEANGQFIREQGLVGGTATAALNSGLLFNLIFHKARFKDDSVKIIRRIQLII